MEAEGKDMAFLFPSLSTLFFCFSSLSVRPSFGESVFLGLHCDKMLSFRALNIKKRNHLNFVFNPRNLTMSHDCILVIYKSFRSVQNKMIVQLAFLQQRKSARLTFHLDIFSERFQSLKQLVRAPQRSKLCRRLLPNV